LANILFSMNAEQKKVFFESAATTGVAYLNRLPPKAEPTVLKLTKTVQRQWLVLHGVAEEQANKPDLQTQNDLLAAIKDGLEAGANISFPSTRKTSDELLEVGYPVRIQFQKYRMSCKLHPKENKYNASFVATHLEPLQADDKKETWDLQVKWSWDIYPYKVMEPLYFDIKALKSLISEFSFKAHRPGIGHRTVEHLKVLESLVEISRFSAMYRYKLLSRDADRLELNISGNQEKINEIDTARLYFEGDRDYSTLASDKQGNRVPNWSPIVVIRIESPEGSGSDSHYFTFNGAEEVPDTGYIIDIGVWSQLKKQFDAIRLIGDSWRNNDLHLIKLATLLGKIGFSRLREYSWKDVKVDFVDNDLTERQQEAVVKSLYTPDISLIHGPPGTGKTRLICEIVQQAVKRNWKTLLVAPTHVAVDNVLEKIGYKDNINAVRCVSERKKPYLPEFIRQFTYEQRVGELPKRCVQRVNQHIAHLKDEQIRIEKTLTCLKELLSLYAELPELQTQLKSLKKSLSSIDRQVHKEFEKKLKDKKDVKENAVKLLASANEKLETSKTKLERVRKKAKQIQGESYSRADQGRLQAAKREVEKTHAKAVSEAQKYQHTVATNVARTEETIKLIQARLYEATTVVHELDAGLMPSKVLTAIEEKVNQVSLEHDKNISIKDIEVSKTRGAIEFQQSESNRLKLRLDSTKSKIDRLKDVQARSTWRRALHITWWQALFIDHQQRQATYMLKIEEFSKLIAELQQKLERAKAAAADARRMKDQAIESARISEHQRQYSIYKSQLNTLPGELDRHRQQLLEQKSQLKIANEKKDLAEAVLRQALDETVLAVKKQIRSETAEKIRNTRKQLRTYQKNLESATENLNTAEKAVTELASQIGEAIVRRKEPFETQIQQTERRLLDCEQDVKSRQKYIEEFLGQPAPNQSSQINIIVDKLHTDLGTNQKTEDFLKDWHGYIEREANSLGPRLASYINLICATTVGIASDEYFGDGKPLEQRQFDLLILDEAGKVTESEFLVAATRARKWTLLGDHKQLPPYYDRILNEHIEKANRALKETNRPILDTEPLRKSLFEKIWQQFEAGPRSRSVIAESRLVQLDIQHRMHPNLALFISNMFYNGKLRSSDSPDFVEKKSINLEYFKYPVTFIEVCPPKYSWGWEKNLSNPDNRRELKIHHKTGFANPKEAWQAVGVLKQLLNEQAIYEEQDELDRYNDRVPVIGIISFYMGQVQLIRRLIMQNKFLEAQANSQSGDKFLCKGRIRVAVNSVDAFQGKECSIIILSFVRSNPYRNVGFVDDANRLNVAMSRARKKLILLGDTKTFINRSKAKDEDIQGYDDTASIRAEREFFSELVKYIEEGYGEVKPFFQTRKMSYETA